MKTLVVDDDDVLRLTIRMALEEKGHEVKEACDGEEAVQKITAEADIEAVILDVNMPKLNGLQALQRIKEINPQVFCLILTAHSDVKDAVTAIKYGAYDYLEKPVEASRILSVMESAKAASALIKVAAFSAPQLQFDQGKLLIGSSKEIKKVFDIIYKLSKVDTSVLIRGESGTGKELVAKALHFNSQRKKGPFVAINCGALPDTLIESELFGHEKGSFTGADRKKIGKFQFAEGGTLFLDEIGDISLPMQIKLLRVLQEKIFTPLGSVHDVKADVRIIAATHQPLEKMIGNNSFRSDLFYRLNVLPITLPPLRERKDDIITLVEFMITKFNQIHHRNIRKVDDSTLQVLKAYKWPGNIRELENVIEHAFILEASDIIHVSSLPSNMNCSTQEGVCEVDEDIETVPLLSTMEHEEEKSFGAEVHAPESDLNYPALKEKFERDFLIKALRTYSGRVNQTAAHTKMTKVTLLRKLEKYGINPREFYKTT